ncbi:MAG: hypothetical protein AB1435_17040 [Chloroflexota bacterium]
MSEETRLVLQAIIGILVAVVVAFVTSWFNRKYFRDQLGEQRFAEVYLDKMLDLWEEVLGIFNEVLELPRSMMEASSRLNSEELEKYYVERLEIISSKVLTLETYYLLLPQPPIDTLKLIWRKLMGLATPGQHSTQEIKETLEELSDLRSELVRQLRDELANLAARKTTVSEILSTPIDVTPPILELAGKEQKH